MSEQLYARFARKPSDLYEVEAVARNPNNFACHIHIVETKVMTTEEYDNFTNDFFTGHDWLAGKGGIYNKDGRKVVEVTAPDRVTLYIDPSGYNYARYVGMLPREPHHDTGTKYPNVRVQLVGKDGNAVYILGNCQRAAREANVPPEEIKKFMAEAMSGDYDNLLATCMRWFDCY